jgi:hypothetical protein
VQLYVKESAFGVALNRCLKPNYNRRPSARPYKAKRVLKLANEI